MSFAQLEPVATYDNGDLYFIPASLTKDGQPFLYSYYRSPDIPIYFGETPDPAPEYEPPYVYFTIFDSDLKTIFSSRLPSTTRTYQSRTVTYERRFIKPFDSEQPARFLDSDWHLFSSDTTTSTYTFNSDIYGPELYEDDNKYHSMHLYLSQSLFDEDDDFEYIRPHVDFFSLDEKPVVNTIGYPQDIVYPGGDIEIEGQYYRIGSMHPERDYELGGYVGTVAKSEYLGGMKTTGIDICGLDGNVKKTIPMITNASTALLMKGKLYISAYDYSIKKNCLFLIGGTSTGIQKVAELSDEIPDPTTYNLQGIKVASDTKGFIIRNGHVFLNE